MNPDDFESAAIGRIAKFKKEGDHTDVLKDVFDRIVNEFGVVDVSSSATIRSHFTPWWRVVGTIVEQSLSSTLLKHSRELFIVMHEGFQSVYQALQSCIARAGLDPDTKEGAMIFSGFYLAYTSAVRAGLESVHVIADPTLGCDLLIGLESCVPMDNKGISNVYKRNRQEVDDSLRGVISSDSSVEAFEEGNVVMEDPSKAFERFWTMMDVSRRSEPEILSETRAWGKFSQSATATLSLLLEQPDALDAPSWVLIEPVEYECKRTSFSIQLSSASFRRRAVLNILFTCSYVAGNSSNALITAAAKTLLNTVLKSLPTDLQQAVALAMKFDAQWSAWKSGPPTSKEVCGPFEKRSRIERNMEPLGEALIALAQVGAESGEPILEPHAVVKIMDSSSNSVAQAEESSQVRSEFLSEKIREYRQYVSDAILCDISDEAEKERLSASDEGMEEAMRNNNDRVLLWQFRRMRFATDLGAFYKHKLVKVDSTVESPQE